MAGCTIRMPDGTSDHWGYGYLKSVYKDRGSFQIAIAKLTKVIENLERYQARLSPVPGDVQELWDDYWSTERLINGINTCIEEYEKIIDSLTTARDNLKTLVAACEYCASKNWGEKSTGSKISDGITAVFTFGQSGSFDSAKDMSFNG